MININYDHINTTNSFIVVKQVRQVQGVSENMQQLLISTKIGCKPGRIKVIYQIQAYNHTILLIIKNPETDTKKVHYDVIN